MDEPVCVKSLNSKRHLPTDRGELVERVVRRVRARILHIDLRSRNGTEVDNAVGVLTHDEVRVHVRNVRSRGREASRQYVVLVVGFDELDAVKLTNDTAFDSIGGSVAVSIKPLRVAHEVHSGVWTDDAAEEAVFELLRLVVLQGAYRATDFKTRESVRRVDGRKSSRTSGNLHERTRSTRVGVSGNELGADELVNGLTSVLSVDRNVFLESFLDGSHRVEGTDDRVCTVICERRGDGSSGHVNGSRVRCFGKRRGNDSERGKAGEVDSLTRVHRDVLHLRTPVVPELVLGTVKKDAIVEDLHRIREAGVRALGLSRSCHSNRMLVMQGLLWGEAPRAP